MGSDTPPHTSSHTSCWKEQGSEDINIYFVCMCKYLLRYIYELSKEATDLHTHTHINVCVCVCVDIGICTCIYINININIYMYMYINIY
jgi:hypothetical protein